MQSASSAAADLVTDGAGFISKFPRGVARDRISPALRATSFPTRAVDPAPGRPQVRTGPRQATAMTRLSSSSDLFVFFPYSEPGVERQSPLFQLFGLFPGRSVRLRTLRARLVIFRRTVGTVRRERQCPVPTAGGTSSVAPTSTSTPAAGAIARAGISLLARHALRHTLRRQLRRIEHQQRSRRFGHRFPVVTGKRVRGVTVLTKAQKHQVEFADRLQQPCIHLCGATCSQLGRHMRR